MNGGTRPRLEALRVIAALAYFGAGEASDLSFSTI